MFVPILRPMKKSPADLQKLTPADKATVRKEGP